MNSHTPLSGLLAVAIAALYLTGCAKHQHPAIEPAPVVDTPAVEFDQQALAEAALGGDLTTIQDALAKGYKIDTRDPNQRTLLMYAAFNGHDDLVETLIKAGADVNAQDATGTSALMFAASGPSQESVRVLLVANAKINMVDHNEHFTALMWAAAEGQAENAKLLLEMGADPKLQDIDGDTAESFAAKVGHDDVIKVLREHESKKE